MMIAEHREPKLRLVSEAGMEDEGRLCRTGSEGIGGSDSWHLTPSCGAKRAGLRQQFLSEASTDIGDEEALTPAMKLRSRAEHDDRWSKRIQQEMEQWKEMAEEERNLRKKAEEEALKWQSKAEELEKQLEQLKKAEGHADEIVKAKKEVEDEEVFAHRYSCIGLGRYWVTHTFNGFHRARDARQFMESPELRFDVAEDPRLSYSFKFWLYPYGGDGDGTDGAVGLTWALLPGSQSESEGSRLMWPVPHDKVKIALRILSLSAAGRDGTKRRKVKKVVLDGTTNDSFREYLAEHAPPRRDNIEGWGSQHLLSKAEFEEGGWTMGPDADAMVVQAELIFK